MVFLPQAERLFAWVADWVSRVDGGSIGEGVEDAGGDGVEAGRVGEGSGVDSEKDLAHTGFAGGLARDIVGGEAAGEHGGEHVEALDPVQQAVLSFTEDVVKNVKASDANLAEVRKHLSDKQVIDLTLLIGLYMMVSRFLETAGVENDTKALDWKTVVPQK